MKHRLLLAALLFVIVLVAALVLLVRGRGAGEEAAAASASDGARSGVVGDRDELPTPAAVGETAREAARPPTGERPRVEHVAGGTFVTGRVIPPAGVPADEEVEVVVEILPPGCDQTWYWAAHYGKVRESGRASVDATGAFRVALPEERAAARLDLDARYLFLKDPVVIEDPELPVTLEPRLGGAIRFRLRPASDSRLDAGALVGKEVYLSWRLASKWWWVDEAPHRALAIDEGLELFAGGLSVANAYTVDARLSPFAPVQLWGLRVEPGVMRIVDLPLLDGVVIIGRVLDDAGLPLGGAHVSTRDAAVKSDEDGGFRLEAVHPEWTEVSAWRDDYLPGETLREPGAGDEVHGVEVVLSRGLAIEGIVRLPDGRPVAVATVLVRSASDRQGRGSLSVRTDGSGRFRREGLEAGSYDLAARVPLTAEALAREGEIVTRDGGERAGSWTGLRSRVAAGAEDVELVLRAPDDVSGVVVDEHGAPIERFEVKVTRDRRRPDPACRLLSHAYGETFEGEDGRFRLEGIPFGRWEIGVEARGFGDAAPRSVELPGGGESLRFVLYRSASIEGIVLDPDGRTVPGAWVSKVELSSRVGNDVGHSSKEAGPDGVFRFGGIDSSHVRLDACGDGFARSESLVVDVTAGGEAVVLRLTRGGTLVVDVLDPADRPAPWARVEVPGGPWSDSGREHDTDERGHLEIVDVTAGEYEVTGRYEDGERIPFRARATVRDGETTRVILGGSAAAALQVRGVVTAGSEPVEGAHVRVRPRSDPESWVRARCDAAGRFTLELDTEGWVVFEVFGRSWGRAEVFEEELDRDDSRALRLDLPTGGMQGRVETADGGAPSFSVEVLVERRPDAEPVRGSEGVLKRSTDADGTWSCPHLPPGSFRVVARSDALVADARGRTLHASDVLEEVVVRDGEITRGVDLVLGPGGRVEGRVLDPDGRPVRGAVVLARSAEGMPLDLKGIVSGEGGAYSFGGLPPGRVLLEARGVSLATSAPQPVRVARGEVVTLDLDLVLATMLTLELAGIEAGRTDVVLRLRDSAGRLHAPLPRRETTTTGKPELHRVFGPLPPGEWLATARLMDGRETTEDFRLAGENRRTIVLELSP